MSIVRFDPFRELDRLQNEVNRLFEGYSGSPEAAQNGNRFAAARTWSPIVDIAESQAEVILRAELPGMKQADIDIELTGDTLTLRGERKLESELRRDEMVRIERSYGRFQRSFTLGVPIDADKVAANYRDGLLEIHLPKSQATRPRKVQVSAGDAPGEIAADGEGEHSESTKNA